MITSALYNHGLAQALASPHCSTSTSERKNSSLAGRSAQCRRLCGCLRQSGSNQLLHTRKALQHRQVKAAAKADIDLLDKVKELSRSQFYRVWLQGAVFLVILASVDAAFSGDWSRVGVISKDVEDGLKPLVVALGLFHIGCATVAAKSASDKKLPVVPAIAKVLAVGFLAMVEVLLKDPEEQR